MNRIILHSDIETLQPSINPAVFEHIRAGQVERFESLGDFYLISFDWYDVLDRHALPAQLIIYLSKEHLFFICENDRLFNKVTALVKEFPEQDRVLVSFFSELMKPDMDHLEELEDEIAEMENNLLVHSKTQCTQGIIRFRRELIRLKKYYEQLNTIFEGLTQNENDLICHADLRYFMVLDKRVDRLFSTVLNLRDFVSQVREAYQAQIDIEQNGIMKIFTVVTSVFLPLSLIVGWYGMNLQMPELSWGYAYPAVVVLCIAVCAACVAYFKIKKWF